MRRSCTAGLCSPFPKDEPQNTAFKDATLDLSEPHTVGNETPAANVGMATGQVLILDFDTYKPDYAGAELLELLLEEYLTPCTDTARGGVQLYFAQRPGLEAQRGTLPAHAGKC